MDGSGVFRRVANVRDQREIGPLIDTRSVLLVVQIGQDFERCLLVGQPADVQVIADGRNSNTAGTALNYIGTIVDNFNAGWRQAHGAPSPPVQSAPRAWHNPNLETRWFMVTGMIGLITMVQMVIITAMPVAREREQETFDQPLVTPFRPIEIMIGKSVPSIFVGLVQVTMILTIALLWFKIPFQGSMPTPLPGGLSFPFCGRGDRPDGLIGCGHHAAGPAGQLSHHHALGHALGLTTPIANMPREIQDATLINPLRYVISILHRVFLEVASLREVAIDLWPLALIALFSLSTAVWMFRRRLV